MTDVVWSLVPDLSWQSWLIIGLALSLVIALEGAYRIHRATLSPRNKEPQGPK